MEKDTKYRDIDKHSVTEMIQSLDLKKFINDNNQTENQINTTYQNYFNKNFTSRYALISNKKNKLTPNLLKLNMTPFNNYYFSFEVLFLLKIILVGTKKVLINGKMQSAFDYNGERKTDTLMSSLALEKSLIDLIDTNINEYGIYRLQYTPPYMKYKYTTEVILQALGKINYLLSLLTNKYNDTNKTRLFHILSETLNNYILDILLLNEQDLKKRSKYRLIQNSYESLDLSSNLTLDEQIIKHILIENTLGFVPFNKKMGSEHANLMNDLNTLDHKTDQYKLSNFSERLGDYSIDLQNARSNFYQKLLSKNTNVDNLIKDYFFNDSYHAFNILTNKELYNGGLKTSLLSPSYEDFKEKNTIFFKNNPHTPYSKETIKELLTLIDRYLVECHISENYKEYKQAYRTTIQPTVENNKKMSNIINFLSSSKSSMSEEKSIELLNLTLDLLNEEKIKQEQKLNDIADKIKEINKYKERPMDFYDDYSFKEYEQPSDNIDKEITSLQESLINIINSIYEDD